MKKNTGSLQLWLWTITPLLFAMRALYDLFLGEGELATVTLIFGMMTLISPFVRQHVLKSERVNMNNAALKRHRYVFNAAWIVIVLALFLLYAFIASHTICPTAP